jgi:hypothetical protein
MKAAIIGVALGLISVSCFAQNDDAPPTPFSVWSVHTPDVIVPGRTPYPVGVLTPMKRIVVRRMEALSNRGPALGQDSSNQPVPCPVQYGLELTNGTITQTIPISNTFLSKNSSQTYTDSGLLNVEFSAGARIALSMVAPKAQFPAVTCAISGLNISIQYELAEQKKASSSEDSH